MLIRLLEISSKPISSKKLDVNNFFGDNKSSIVKELFNLLNIKNGFLAFENALEIYSFDDSKKINLRNWNSFDLWKKDFKDVIPLDTIFFGQDIFGNQFGISNDKVIWFNTESTEIEIIANSLEDWAKILLNDYNYYTGYPFAKEWQEKNGDLEIGNRLLPKLPFILGGEYKIENFYKIDMLKGIKFCAYLASQLKEYPDGSTIKIKK
jgi:hypothetical protein